MSLICRDSNDKIISLPYEYKYTMSNSFKSEIKNIWDKYSFNSIEEIKIGSYVTMIDVFGVSYLDNCAKLKVEAIEDWIIPNNYNSLNKYRVSEHGSKVFHESLNEPFGSCEDKMRYANDKLDYEVKKMITLSYENLRTGERTPFERYLHSSTDFEFVNHEFLESIVEEIDILKGNETHKEWIEKRDKDIKIRENEREEIEEKLLKYKDIDKEKYYYLKEKYYYKNF